MDERNEDYDIYGSFACVYDKFMDNVPYKEWGKYLKSLLEEQGISDGLMLELGCGTGSLTEILADAGYDMIGVDLSAVLVPGKTADLCRTGNNDCFHKSGTDIDIHIAYTAKRTAGTGVDHFFLPQFTDSHKIPTPSFEIERTDRCTQDSRCFRKVFFL